jgi:hypothetical protein
MVCVCACVCVCVSIMVARWCVGARAVPGPGSGVREALHNMGEMLVTKFCITWLHTVDADFLLRLHRDVIPMPG